MEDITYGDLIKDAITGKKGYVHAILSYKTGCVYYKVDGSDHKADDAYIDGMRAVLIKKGAVEFEEVTVTRYVAKDTGAEFSK